MKVVILAAGLGTRLLPLTKDTPKSLLKVGNKTIIEHQFDALYANGIEDITIVVGHQADKIKRKIGKKAKYILNKEYATTNSSYSLWLAREEIKDGFISLNSDMLFNKKILQKLIESKAENAIMIDRHVKLTSDMQKIIMENGLVRRMGKDIPFENAVAEAVGPAKFSKKGAEAVIDKIEGYLSKNNKGRWAYSIFSDISKKIDFYGVDVEGIPWIEIDTVTDLRIANDRINEIIGD